jgi:hypothetical protein
MKQSLNPARYEPDLLRANISHETSESQTPGKPSIMQYEI